VTSSPPPISDLPAAPSRPAAPPRRRAKAVLLKLALLGGSLGLALLLVEGGLRLFVDVTDVPLMFWDPLVGPRRIPRQEGRLLFGREVNGRYRFNGQGWNNLHEYETVKPAGGRRVCLVGDSFVEAMQVDVEKACFSVAEKLMSRPGRPVEWYAFGNSGLGTAHEHLIIRHYVLDYRPDVVVMLFVTNDPVDCSPYLVAQEPWMARLELGPAGELVLIPPAPYVPSAFNRFMANFALVRYLKVQKGLFMRAGPAVAAGQASLREGMGEGGAAGAMAGLSLEERVGRTWRLVEAILARTKQDCAERGATFMIAYQGHRWEIEAAALGKPYAAPPREVDPFCLNERVNEMGRQYVEPMAKKLGIPYLDLTAALIAEVRRTGRRHNFPDDAHYNEVGHAGAGRAMAGWIEREWSAPPGATTGR
jgi:hypothetical protein